MNSIEFVNQLKTGISTYYNELYSSYYPTIQRFILKNNGTIEDAQDIFQDMILVLIKKLDKDNFELTASLKTYIYAICKNLWYKRLNSAHFKYTIELDEELSETLYDEFSKAIEEEKSMRDTLHLMMSKITHHCNRLINAMFFQHKQVEEIQKEFGYSTAHNAQNQKYKCIQQLKKVSSNYSFE